MREGTADENRGAPVSGRNTKRVQLIRVCAACAIVSFALAGKAGSMDVFRSKLVRDVRYSKFNLTFTNKSTGTVLDYGIRSLRNKHMLYLHFELYERFTQFQGNFIVQKCKEYYVDCETVISYNITDGCSKLNVFFHFMSIENLLRNVDKCPLYGEYYYNNFTINAEEFGAIFSYPFEKWWERYWKIRVRLFDVNQSEIALVSNDFYFLEFRIRHH